MLLGSSSLSRPHIVAKVAITLPQPALTSAPLSRCIANIELAGAVYEALGIAEVFLRNAVDAQLRIWNAARHPMQPVASPTTMSGSRHRPLRCGEF